MKSYTVSYQQKLEFRLSTRILVLNPVSVVPYLSTIVNVKVQDVLVVFSILIDIEACAHRIFFP